MPAQKPIAMPSRTKQPPKRPQRTRGTNNAPQSVAHDLRRRKIVDMRVRGYDFYDIGEELGISSANARSALVKEMQNAEKEINQDIRSLLGIEIDRLEYIIRDALWPKIEKGSLEAIDRLLKVQGQKARFLGLYAPESQHVQHTGKIEFEYAADKEV